MFAFYNLATLYKLMSHVLFYLCFQIFPFHWVIYIFRSILFGSLKYHRGISAGILVAYFLCAVSAYLYAALKNEYKNVSDKTLIKLTDDEADGKSDKELFSVDSCQMLPSGSMKLKLVQDYAQGGTAVGAVGGGGRLGDGGGAAYEVVSVRDEEDVEERGNGGGGGGGRTNKAGEIELNKVTPY